MIASFVDGPLNSKKRSLPFNKAYWILPVDGQWAYYRYQYTWRTRKGVKKGQPTKEESVYKYDGPVAHDSPTLAVTLEWMEREGVELDDFSN